MESERDMTTHRTISFLAFVLSALAFGVPYGWAAGPVVNTVVSQVSTSKWEVLQEPVYSDQDDDWAKDPSVIKVGDTWYMYYTSANPWGGGKGPCRIDYATSPDGLTWTWKGLSIPKGKPGEWDEERPQAPAKPILKDGVYYMYYAGKCATKAVAIGYATSTDLIHWTKNPGNPVLSQGKCNDPFIFIENGVYYLFFTSGGDCINYVTSTNLVDWSKPMPTGAVGEGSIVIKDGPIYTLLGCIGFSGNGEFYRAYTTMNFTNGFVATGDRINIKNPEFAKGTLSHGDIIRQGDEYWFYFQATRDGGKIFKVGLAKQPVPGK